MKKFLLVISGLLVFWSPKVAATTYTDKINHGNYFSGLYITKVLESRTIIDYLYMPVRQSDGHWVYCLQPGVNINVNAIYYGTETDWWHEVGLTKTQGDQISLLAFYGYQYYANGYDHREAKWYAVTQLLIWLTVGGSNWDIYFTSGLGGVRLPNQYATEIAELEALVAQHIITPVFNDDEFKVGSSVTITDQNHVLNQFISQSNADLCIISQSGNDLTITALIEGTCIVTFRRSFNYWERPSIAYINDMYKNVFMGGDFKLLTNITFAQNIMKGKVQIEKTSEILLLENKHYSYQTIPLANVLMGLYDVNDNLLLFDYTNEHGYLEFSELNLGQEYYVKELKPSLNHVSDEKQYRFVLDTFQNPPPVHTISLKSYLPKGTLVITILDEVSKSGMTSQLIEIFTKDNQLIYAGYTNNLGQIIIENLFVGKFYLKDQNNNYVDFEIEDNGLDVTLTLMSNNKVLSSIGGWIISVPKTSLMQKSRQYLGYLLFQLTGSIWLFRKKI